MLDTVFGFGGRINRLQYFAGVLALVTALVLPMLMIIGLVVANRGAAGSGLLLMGLLLLLAIPAVIWVGLSLQARRFRDIGWNPLYVIPPLILIGIADRLVAQAVPALSIGPRYHQTAVGLLVSLATAGCLLFWPGKSNDGAEDAAWADWPEPDEPSSTSGEPAPSAPAAPAPALATPAPYARTAPSTPTFGRRGL